MTENKKVKVEDPKINKTKVTPKVKDLKVSKPKVTPKVEVLKISKPKVTPKVKVEKKDEIILKDVKIKEKKVKTDKKVKTEIKIIKKTVFPVEKSKLNPSLFEIKINKQSIFDSIISERASRRQGTHQVKNRSAVAGGGRKPWKQKGTGRARAGTLSSPIFRSGGVVFGPQKNKNYKLAVNKKIKSLAFKSALTIKAQNSSIFLKDLKLEKPNTKKVIEFIKTIDMNKDAKKILFISNDSLLYKSTANITNVATTTLKTLLIEKIIHYDILIFSKDTFKELEGRI